MQKDLGASLSLLEKSRLDRRQLLRLGLASAPILMTLASRSAFGCQTTQASAFGSINASKPNLVTVSGRDPNWWQANTSQWPLPYCAVTSRHPRQTATLFNSCFPGRTSSFKGKTLLEVLNMPSAPGSEVALAQHCIAALLNASSGKTNAVCDARQVSTIWSEYVAKGHYEPTAGVKWWINSPSTTMMKAGGGGICGYLRTTWA